jgi:hypothetical protein
MKLQYLILLSLFLCQGGKLAAQSIFDALTKPEQGKADVTLLQPATVRTLIDSRTGENKVETDGNTRFFKLEGFTIQVFSGNSPRHAKDEAFSKKEQIDRLFSAEQLTASVDYRAPFWILRAGEFSTYEEALSTMYRIATAFPLFRKEMKIVKENIRIPVE